VPLLILQIRSDHVLASGTDGHAVGRFVVGAVAEALPHGGGLGLVDTLAIVDGVARIGYLLHPVGEAAEKLSVVVREAGGKVERPVRADGAHGTGGNAELAFETGVVVEGLTVGIGLSFGEDSAEKDEVAEFRMDQVAVDAHVAKAGRDGNGLVRHDPWGVAGAPNHLHGKAHGGIDRADAARFEPGDDGGADLVDLVASAVELEIGDRPRRAADRLAGHAHDVAE
jgi:hypothetical protein